MPLWTKHELQEAARELGLDALLGSVLEER